jgi:alkyldihydroxyacetonephosphate synthase
LTLAARIEEVVPGVVVSGSDPDRIAYARDLWPRHHLAVSAGRIADHRPDLVVWPRSAEEVAAIVKVCAAEGVPLVPFGAGSGVCGGVLPDNRTVVLDLKKLANIRSISRDTHVLDVGAGALGIRLEEDLQADGFTLGHFPSSILCSTVGGWVAARSAGQCSGLYGKIEDMVVSLECVVGNGEIVRFRRRTNGPDMTPLIIGSEGVLGVVTSAELRLHPAPQSRTFGALSFPNVEAGWEFLRSIFQAGLRPAVARLYDVFDSFIARLGSVRRNKQKATPPDEASSGQGAGFGASVLRKVLRRPGMVNKLIDAAPSGLMGGATLIILFEGSSEHTTADMARAKTMALGQGAKDLGEGPARHWLEHRYSVSYRQSPVFMAGAFSDTMEVAAPWSKLGDLYRAVREALGKHVFVMAHLSHAYPDGCSIYFTFAGSAPTPAAMESIYDATWRSAMDAAIGAGGTLSHHHGVGRSKAPKLGAELGLGVPIIHALRRVLDPSGIMNPGNLLPRDTPRIRPAMAVPAEPAFDAASLLVHASGKSTLAEVDAVLARNGLSLGLEGTSVDKSKTVAAWLAEGAPGSHDPWLDPADHLIAGFTARLPAGEELEIRPSPRRAVGPDLFALFFGMGGQVGEIRSAWLRVFGALRPARALKTTLERNPAMDDAEQAWIDRIAKSARRP